MRPGVGTLLRWALAAGIVAWSAWSLADAWTALDVAALTWRPVPLVAAMGVGALALITLAVVSGVGLRAAGLPAAEAPAGFWSGWMRVWFQGYFYRYVPGKVMLVVERARLGERLGVPRAASVLLVVWESFLLLAGAGLFGGVGLLALPAGPGGLAPAVPVSGALAGALAGAALVGSIAMWPVLGAVARRMPALAARLPGMVLSVPARHQFGLVVGNALGWGLLGASFALVAHGVLPAASLSAEASAAPAASPDAAFLVVWFVAAYVGGQLAGVVPAGIGIREGMLVAGLAGLVPAPVAMAWAVVHRVLLAVVELLLLGATLFVRLPE